MTPLEEKIISDFETSEFVIYAENIKKTYVLSNISP
jgi:hypothetical protein